MTDSPATPVLTDAATRDDLVDWGPLKEATGPEMTTRGIKLWSDGASAESGIWECTAGPSRWQLDTNEFVHILSGSMTVTRDLEDPILLGPGDTAIFERGWRGAWEIHATLRKLYVIY